MVIKDTTKCRRHSVVVAGLTYDAIGCGQYPKATKRIIHIRQSRDSYTVISCLSMNDLYREKGLSPKQIYNRRLKDQKPVIEDFLLWLDQLHPES